MKSVASLLVLLIAGVCACGDDGAPPDAAIVIDAPPQEGTISWAWTIEMGGMTVDCETAGAISVTLRAQPDGGAAQIDVSACGAGSTTTLAFPATTYDLTFLLIGSGNETLDSQEQFNVDVVTGADTDVGTVVFDVTALVQQPRQ